MSEQDQDEQARMEMGESNSAEGAERNGLADRRMERIHEYLRDALEQADPLQASLGAINADLLGVADRLRRRLDESLPETLEGFEQLKPVIDSMLRVHKQIGQFAQLAARLARAPQKPAELA